MKLNNLVVKFGLTGILTIGSLAALPGANAFGLDSVKQVAGAAVGGPSGSSAQKPAVDVDALLTEQKDLMGRFKGSMNNMLLAQSRTLKAAGLVEDADRAVAAANNYGSGNVISREQLDRDTQSTIANARKIEELKKKGAALSSEGRTELATAVPHYAKGLYEGGKLPNAFSKWTSNAKGGLSSLAANPLKAKQLSSGLDDVATVTANLPALLKTWGDSSSAFVSYAKSNKVQVGDVEKSLGDL